MKRNSSNKFIYILEDTESWYSISRDASLSSIVEACTTAVFYSLQKIKRQSFCVAANRLQVFLDSDKIRQWVKYLKKEIYSMMN
jgi:hypothetical protein